MSKRLTTPQKIGVADPEVTIQPSRKDTTIHSLFPTSNYGSQTWLRIQDSTADGNLRELVEFPISWDSHDWITGFSKSANNPLKDLDGGYWITGFYNDYDSRIYLLVQPNISGKTIRCFSFTLANWETPANWTDHGTVLTEASPWVTAEPHSVFFETQAMADAREGVGVGEGTRKWRLYYGGGADAAVPVKFATASEETPTSWTIYGGVYGYGTAYHGTTWICDPEAFIHDGIVWMAVRSYVTGDRVGQAWFTKSTNGIDGWTDCAADLDDYFPVMGTCYSSLGGIAWVAASQDAQSDINDVWSPDGESAILYSGNPVMAPGGSGAWDEKTVFSTLIKDKNENLSIGGTYYLYYYGRLANVTNPQIGAAKTTAMTHKDADIPVGATIESAILSLYYYYEYLAGGYIDPVGKTVKCYRLVRLDWSELQSTWNVYTTSNSWTTAGASHNGNDHDTTYNAETTFPASFGWMNWDVKNHILHAQANAINALFFLKFLNEGLGSGARSYAEFYSKEEATQVTLRPKLVITYTSPAPAVGGKSSGIAAKMIAAGAI